MPSAWVRILSFLYPVPVRKSGTAINPKLELYYYRGTYQLGTPDALYSSGKHYEPIVQALSRISPSWLKKMEQVLLLGTGLASGVHILDAKRLYPKVRMVEIDALVLDWAMEFLPERARATVEPVCADALEFVAKDQALYDLIIVDIFIGRVVPEAVVLPEFLNQCKGRLQPGGKLLLNFIIQKKGDDVLLKGRLEALFDGVDEVGFGQNRVYIASSR